MRNCAPELGYDADNAAEYEYAERTPKPFRLALFWLGLQTVWGALLGISLQARSSQLAGGDALIAYGHLAAIGATVAAVTQIAVGFWSDARRKRGSRRIEFYVAGAYRRGRRLAAFYGATTFAMLTLAYVALQLTLNLAIGPYQAIIPDFIESGGLGVASSWLAALQSIGNAIGAIAAYEPDANARSSGVIDRAAGRIRARRRARTSGRLAIRAEPEREPMHLTRAFADLVRFARAGVRRFFHDGGVFVFLRERRPRIQRRGGDEVYRLLNLGVHRRRRGRRGNCRKAQRSLRQAIRRRSAGGSRHGAALIVFIAVARVGGRRRGDVYCGHRVGCVFGRRLGDRMPDHAAGLGRFNDGRLESGVGSAADRGARVHDRGF